jgi:hypothetical protein
MSTDILVVQINGALPLAYPNNKNRSSDYACVVFIFFYSFGYSIGFGPNAWVYGTEVFLLLLPSCLELTQPIDFPNAPPCKRHQHLCQCRCNRLYCCCSILPRCSVQHRFQNIFHIFLSQRSVTYRKSSHLLTLHFLVLTPSEDHHNLLSRDERQIFGRDG